jgi:hypothetical protein
MEGLRFCAAPRQSNHPCLLGEKDVMYGTGDHLPSGYCCLSFRSTPLPGI